MAYILEKIGNTYNLPKKYFTCDAKSDLDGISLVDVPIGSEAYCILEEESYILDSNKQWHKKKISEDATGQVQADLSQTDSTQADYVKGVIRQESLPEGYPYKEIGTFLDGTFEFADYKGLYMHRITDENFAIADGKSYTVIWDGEAYQCVATTFEGSLILGNLHLAIPEAADTGEPFLFAMMSEIEKVVYATDTAATHTITVRGEVAYPIAPEFLPDKYVTKTEVEAVRSTAETAQSTAETAQTKANEAVKYTTSQNLTDKQKQNARTNIGAGTSNFSGNYNDLANKPILLSVPTQSDIGTTKIDVLDYIITSDEVKIYSTQHIFDTSSSIFTNLPKTVIYGYDDSSRITIYNSALHSTWRLIDSINVKVNNTVYYGVGIGAYIGTLQESYFFISNNGFIVVSKDGLKTKNSIKYFTIELNNISLTMPIAYLSERFIPSSIQRVGDDLIISSSTAESTKKFKITVDDSGTLSATEVT